MRQRKLWKIYVVILVVITSLAIIFYIVYVTADKPTLQPAERHAMLSTNKLTTQLSINPTTISTGKPTIKPTIKRSITPTIKPTIEDITSTYGIHDYINFIREIEASITFTNSNASIYDELYCTGYSPHQYNGIYSLNKTCKHAGFSYLCKPDAINGIIKNKWTLKINQQQLKPKTIEFLKELQNENYYTNLHKQYINNLKYYKSPYMKNINAVYFGNSYLRQIMESYHCLIDNITNNDANHVINKYMPWIRAINKSMAINMDYNALKCDGLTIDHEVIWNTRYENALRLKQEMLDNIMNVQRNNNIKICSSHSLYTHFNDGSYLLFRFMDREKNKTIFNYFKQQHHIENSNDIDIFIFNSGNSPNYDFPNRLHHDLKQLNYSNKPIIFLTHWDNTRWITIANLKKLYAKYPNLIYIDWGKRFLYYPHYKSLYSSYNHLCIPGIPDHAVLALNNLINVLIKIYYQ